MHTKFRHFNVCGMLLRLVRTALLGALVTGLCLAEAGAQNTDINFDVTPTGAAIANNAVVNNTYSSLGVTFQTVPCPSNVPNCWATTSSAYAIACPTCANSLPNVVSTLLNTPAVEMQWGAIQANFANGAASVSVSVAEECIGQDLACLGGDPANERAFLAAYNSSGSQIGFMYATGALVRQTLTVKAPSGQSIAFAQFTVPYDFKNQGANQLAGSFDDFSFTTSFLGSEMDTADDKNAVYYLGFDSNLYELAWNGSWVWTQDTGTGGRPSVASGTGIAAYVNTIYNGNEVFYLQNSSGSLHIEQLWTSALDQTDLTQAASGKPVAPGGKPVGYIDTIADTDNVFYLGTDQFVHVLTWSPGLPWKEDTTLDGTTRTAAVVGSPLSGHPTAASQEIFYLGANQHVYELWRWSKTFDGWHSTDVTAANVTKPVATPGSPLAGFYDKVEGNDAMFYVGTNGHVYELLFSSSQWSSIDVTAKTGAPSAATGSPLAAHLNTVAGTEEVFFLDSNKNVQEFWAPSTNPTGWNNGNVTAQSQGALAFPGSPLSTNVSTIDNTDHVFYIGSDQNVHEMWWNGIWHSDAVNTQTSPAAPPAVP